MPFGYRWNDDFTTYSGNEFAKISADPAFAQMFYDAIQEKFLALQELYFPGPYTGLSGLEQPIVGDDALLTYDGSVQGFWQAVMAAVWSYQYLFVPPAVNYDGNPGMTNGALAYPMLPFYASEFYQGAPWVGGNDAFRYTFEYPREINALTDAGTDGDIARFVATSEPDRLMSGRYYQHVSGSWVPAPVPTWDPDHLFRTSTDSPWPPNFPANGGAVPGEYFTGDLANQIRDSLNNMVALAQTSLLLTNPPTGDFTILYSDDVQNDGGGGSTAATEADLTSGANVAHNGAGGPFFETVNTYGGVTGNISSISKRAKVLQYNIGTPSGFARDIQWYYFPWLGPNPGAFPSPTFEDNMGDFSTPFYQWSKFHTDSAYTPGSSDTTIPGPTFPATARLTIPPTTYHALTTGQLAGYQLNYGVIFRFDVAGGFTYTAAATF